MPRVDARENRPRRGQASRSRLLAHRLRLRSTQARCRVIFSTPSRVSGPHDALATRLNRDLVRNGARCPQGSVKCRDSGVAEEGMSLAEEVLRLGEEVEILGSEG